MQLKHSQFGLWKLLLAVTLLSLFLAAASRLWHELILLSISLSVITALLGFVCLLFSAVSFISFLISKDAERRQFERQQSRDLAIIGGAAVLPLALLSVVVWWLVQY